jgi:hypothetical protein
MKKNNKDKWEIANHVSTFIVALIAVLGFVYAIRSSNETAKVLSNVSQGIVSITAPVLYFNEYDWFRGDFFDCENPPVGINIKYANGSNMPIKIIKNYITVGTFVGDTVRGNYLLTLCDTLQSILSPKDVKAVSFTFNKEIQGLFVNKTMSGKPPYVYVRFNGVISNLSESVIYDVQLAHFIKYDCKALNVHSISKIEEKYTLISNDK